MNIFEHFEQQATVPDFVFLNEGEVWGPFVVLDSVLGEMLGAQLALLEDRITWFTPDEVGRIIVFSTPPQLRADGSIIVESSDTDKTYVFRILQESDYQNFGLPAPVSLDELYEIANNIFSPFELLDE
jgi:hypothetical protein